MFSPEEDEEEVHFPKQTQFEGSHSHIVSGKMGKGAWIKVEINT